MPVAFAIPFCNGLNACSGKTQTSKVPTIMRVDALESTTMRAFSGSWMMDVSTGCMDPARRIGKFVGVMSMRPARAMKLEGVVSA